MRYRKKPVVIEATRWFKNGDHPKDASRKVWHQDAESGAYFYTEGKVVRYFRMPNIDGTSCCPGCGHTMHDHGWVDTLEGGHTVCTGDWIVTGIKGEYYPVKDDIFEATYEPVEKENER